MAIAVLGATLAATPCHTAAAATVAAPASNPAFNAASGPASNPAGIATNTTPASDIALPPSSEQTVNPYGPDALWRNGDLVARATLIVLAVMSIGSWYIIIAKLIEQLRLARQAGAVRRGFWLADSIEAATAGLTPDSPFRYIAETGSKSALHHEGALLEKIDLSTWIRMTLQRAVEKVQSRLQDGLPFLATVGSTAPFVGLFGTVWGIYNALTQIGVAGQASIDKVAGPVGEALIMTAFGLFVAVPAVLGYNWLIKRNKGAMEEVRAFSADLHAVLLSGLMSTSQSAQPSRTGTGTGSGTRSATAKIIKA